MNFWALSVPLMSINSLDIMRQWLNMAQLKTGSRAGQASLKRNFH